MTFKVRGCYGSFTTPALAGARVRGAKQGDFELVMPNPSGAGGDYVVRWAGVRAFCTPTVHDTLLLRLLARSPAVDPQTLRQAALSVAMEGYAGTAAANAAKASVAADSAHSRQAQSQLLGNLVDQAAPAGRTAAAPHTAEFARQAQAVIRGLEPKFVRPAAHLASALADLGAAFAPVGIRPNDTSSRVPLLVQRLEDTHGDIAAWISADTERRDLGGLGSAVADSLWMAAQWGHAAVTSARSLLADPLALLTRRLTNPAAVAAIALRADWLLDGWERLCLIWRTARDAGAGGAALLEMAQGVPALPREVFDWRDPKLPIQPPAQRIRAFGADRSLLSGGAAFLLTERNEMLRSMSL